MVINLSGSLNIGASCGGCADGPFTDIPLGWGNSCCGDMSFNVCSGLIVRQINSPADYVTLSGVGASDTVTQGTFIYVVTSTPMFLRLTYKDTVDDVSVEPCGGLYLAQIPATNWLKLLEVMGSGTITYLVAGQL